ncbi:MAG: hypothetical protein ACD_11C00075G0005 [uncultured bacterium]|nr:MAG: hypothetical protein ACD_11C00075G0005 [uncultured bacterium]HBR71758.1 hypothetical protein [Candidatus Moranbacteria bacterium]
MSERFFGKDSQDLQNKTDEELVGVVLSNPDYYEILMSRYEDKLRRYIMRISSVTKEDAEDVLQDVFISAYKNLNGFDRDLKFSSWIYRITHNKVISSFRKKEARPKTITYEGDNDLLNILQGDDDLARELEKGCTAKQVSEILSRMDERYREALILRFIEDKNYQEISDILQKPMGTVATLINRAKKQFKERFVEK